MSTSTAWRYVNETVDMLATRAQPRQGAGRADEDGLLYLLDSTSAQPDEKADPIGNEAPATLAECPQECGMVDTSSRARQQGDWRAPACCLRPST
ncbi:transposase family protein [Actinomadura madurae]|nr:transposase family protein [Actinomadura madurae]